MPSRVGRCATAWLPSALSLPVGVARCSRCSRLPPSSSSAEAKHQWSAGSIQSGLADRCTLRAALLNSVEERQMASKDNNVFVVLSLSGGNDGLNTVIPYTNGRYYDYRPTLGIPEDKLLKINNELGFYPAMGPL